MNILVFCGARTGTNPVYADYARVVADAFVQRGIGLVYGGGNVGLMGVLANRMLDQDGTVIGVIPTFMRTEEVALERCTQLIEVQSMHERKLRMLELCQGILALPGGFGTMDELFEAVTWRQIGLHDRPIGVLNVADYYTPLSTMVDHMLDEAFLTPVTHGLLRFETDILPMLDWLENHGSDNLIDPLLPRWT